MKLQKQHLCMRRCCFLQKNNEILKSCLITHSKEEDRDTVELVFNTPSNLNVTVIVNCLKQGMSQKDQKSLNAIEVKTHTTLNVSPC